MADGIYDLVVIGAGPGGYVAALRGAQLGLSVACVERERPGGICLNWGCIPTKALLKSADLLHTMRHAERYGIRLEGTLSVDLEAMIGRSRTVADQLASGVGSLFRKYGVAHIRGEARLTGPGTIEVLLEGERTMLEARHTVVATGARARTFPGIEPDGERIYTYRRALVPTSLPDRLVILGAGAIGSEFAWFYRSLGCEVTLVEGQEHILPLEEPDIAAVVTRGFKKDGIRIRTSTFCKGVERDGAVCRVRLERKGEMEEIEADEVLVALGIRPNTEGIGLESLGVELDRRGFIVVDGDFRTTGAGNIYAIGDCTASPALAHVAMAEAHVCVERIAGHHAEDVDYRSIPACTYCQPEVASIGWKEAELEEAGIPYSVGRFPFLANGKALGAGHPEGFIKVYVSEEDHSILGAHMVGHSVTDLVAEISLARGAEANAETLMHSVHPHPTLSEAVMEAVANAVGASVHI